MLFSGWQDKRVRGRVCICRYYIRRVKSDSERGRETGDRDENDLTEEKGVETSLYIFKFTSRQDSVW